jgi:hypothetical protein
MLFKLYDSCSVIPVISMVLNKNFKKLKIDFKLNLKQSEIYQNLCFIFIFENRFINVLKFKNI